MSMIDSVYASNIMTHIFHFVFASVNKFSKYYKTILCKSVINLSFLNMVCLQLLIWLIGLVRLFGS